MSKSKKSSKKTAQVTAEPTTNNEAPKAATKKTAKAEKAQKTPLNKEPKTRKSPEQLQSELAEARKNYKRTVEFLCTKTKTREVGVIRSARLDKRTDFIQYRIEIIAGDLMGQVFGKGWDSKDLEWLS